MASEAPFPVRAGDRDWKMSERGLDLLLRVFKDSAAVGTGQGQEGQRESPLKNEGSEYAVGCWETFGGSLVAVRPFVAAYMFVLRIAEYIGRRLGVINSDGSGVDPTQLVLPAIYLYAFASPQALPLCVSHCAQDWAWSQQVQRMRSAGYARKPTR